MAKKWYEVDDATGEIREIPVIDEHEAVSDLLFGPGYAQDTHAQELFFEAVFEKSQSAYDRLVDYVWDEYGIDFEEAFAWEDFREWYGNN